MIIKGFFVTDHDGSTLFIKQQKYIHGAHISPHISWYLISGPLYNSANIYKRDHCHAGFLYICYDGDDYGRVYDKIGDVCWSAAIFHGGIGSSAADFDGVDGGNPDVFSDERKVWGKYECYRSELWGTLDPLPIPLEDTIGNQLFVNLKLLELFEVLICKKKISCK